jgi:hypothetical protein
MTANEVDENFSKNYLQNEPRCDFDRAYRKESSVKLSSMKFSMPKAIAAESVNR